MEINDSMNHRSGDRPATVRCFRCGAVVGELQPGQTIRDIKPCPCTIVRRKKPEGEGE